MVDKSALAANTEIAPNYYCLLHRSGENDLGVLSG